MEDTNHIDQPVESEPIHDRFSFYRGDDSLISRQPQLDMIPHLDLSGLKSQGGGDKFFVSSDLYHSDTDVNDEDGHSIKGPPTPPQKGVWLFDTESYKETLETGSENHYALFPSPPKNNGLRITLSPSSHSPDASPTFATSRSFAAVERLKPAPLSITTQPRAARTPGALSPIREVPRSALRCCASCGTDVRDTDSPPSLVASSVSSKHGHRRSLSSGNTEQTLPATIRHPHRPLTPTAVSPTALTHRSSSDDVPVSFDMPRRSADPAGKLSFDHARRTAELLSPLAKKGSRQFPPSPQAPCICTTDRHDEIDLFDMLRASCDITKLAPNPALSLAPPPPKLSQLRRLIRRTAALTTSPLIEAAKANDLHSLQRLLQTHTTNPTDSQGYTALHHAAALGHEPIATALLLRNAQTDARTRAQDRTPLHLAAQHGHAALCASLAAFGADPAARSRSDGATPLHLAAHAGHADCIALLLTAGAAPDARDTERMTPLVWAVQARRAAAARALLRAGANPDARVASGVNLELASRQGGATVLQKAVAAGAHALVRLLLEHAAEPDAMGPNGLRALHRAAAKGDLLAVEMLLEHGACVDALTDDSWTPLHSAARAGHAKVCRALVRAGASVDAKTNRGIGVPEMAARHGFAGILGEVGRG